MSEYNISLKSMQITKKKFWSTAWKVFGTIPLIASLLLLIYFYNNNPFPSFNIPIKISLMALVASFLCFRYAKRYEATPAEELLEKDNRPPILYLRPFNAEQDEGPILSVFLRKFPRKKPDEKLIELMNDLGPFISISHPEKKVPELGAARKCLQDTDWKNEVSQLICKSRYVIIYAAGVKEVLKEHYRKVHSLLGEMITSPYNKPKGLKNAVKKLYKLNRNPIEVTSGLLWEVEEAIKKQPSTKIVLAVPINIASYEAFRFSTEKLFPQPLPEAKKSWAQKISDETNILGFIHFDPDWDPHFVKVIKPRFIESIKKLDAKEIALKEALTKALKF